MWARSYALRAVLAVGLFVIFYAAAIGIALSLLAIPYALYVHANRISLKLTVACVFGAGAVLWGIVPRWRRFEAPGPRITEADQPRIFALVRSVAQRMGAEMPAEVYLIPDVNAFVAQRGGFLGVGGRRIMGVGLGLLAVDNVSQLEATLAHEMGHFLGGETKLNGFVYQTRAAMIRTLETLRASGSALLHKPFEWTLATYLRLTQAISRQQELLSDEWSVRIAGKQAHVSGLRAEGVHGAAFSLYIRQEVSPLADAGLAPENLFEGFRHYTRSSTWAERSARLQEAISHQASDPYDSHPALEERIAFAQKLALPDRPMDPTPAHTLIADPERLEREFSAFLRPTGLRPIAWNDVAAHWSARWEKTAAQLQSSMPSLTVGQLATLLRDSARMEAVAVSLYPELAHAGPEDRKEHAPGLLRHAASAYLASVLARQGFSWRTAPGDPIELVRGERVVNPVTVVEELTTKEGTSLDTLLTTLQIPPDARGA